MAHRIEGDVIVTGSMTAASYSGSHQRGNSALEAGSLFEIPLTNWRVWDAFGTNLGTAGTDDLGYGGVFGTNGVSVRTSDATSTTVTQYARTQVLLPLNYVAGQNISVAFHAGMIGRIADTSATLDLVGYSIGPNTEVSADLVTTAATFINSLTFAETSFVVTPTNLVVGTVLDLRAVITATAGAGTSCIGAFTKSYLVLTSRG